MAADIRRVEEIPRWLTPNTIYTDGVTMYITSTDGTKCMYMPSVELPAKYPIMQIDARPDTCAANIVYVVWDDAMVVWNDADGVEQIVDTTVVDTIVSNCN